jgi:hypothetical protein
MGKKPTFTLARDSYRGGRSTLISSGRWPVRRRGALIVHIRSSAETCCGSRRRTAPVMQEDFAAFAVNVKVDRLRQSVGCLWPACSLPRSATRSARCGRVNTRASPFTEYPYHLVKLTVRAGAEGLPIKTCLKTGQGSSTKTRLAVGAPLTTSRLKQPRADL